MTPMGSSALRMSNVTRFKAPSNISVSVALSMV